MIYQNQTAARLILQTDVNFNTDVVSSRLIKYRKPSGTTGSWTAATLTGSETTGKIYIDFSASNKFDEAGSWTLWAYLTFSDGRFANGAAATYQVPTEGA